MSACSLSLEEKENLQSGEARVLRYLMDLAKEDRTQGQLFYRGSPAEPEIGF